MTRPGDATTSTTSTTTMNNNTTYPSSVGYNPNYTNGRVDPSTHQRLEETLAALTAKEEEAYELSNRLEREKERFDSFLAQTRASQLRTEEEQQAMMDRTRYEAMIDARAKVEAELEGRRLALEEEEENLRAQIVQAKRVMEEQTQSQAQKGMYLEQKWSDLEQQELALQSKLEEAMDKVRAGDDAQGQWEVELQKMKADIENEADSLRLEWSVGRKAEYVDRRSRSAIWSMRCWEYGNTDGMEFLFGGQVSMGHKLFESVVDYGGALWLLRHGFT